MNVALLAPRFHPHVGGVETHIDRIAASLSALGCRVDVLAQERARAAPRSERRGEYRVLRFDLRPASDTFPFAPGVWRYLHRFSERYDVIHSHSYHSVAALAPAVCARVPVVFTPHYHGVGHTPLARALHRPYRVPGAFIVRRAARLICVSRAEAMLVTRDFAEAAGKIRVVPNGVERERIGNAAPYAGEPPTVVVLGRLEAYKRVDLTLRAVAELPAFQVVVIGDGPQRAELLELAADLGLGPRARFLGRVDDESLYRWLRTAAVLVSMSEQEAFGLAPIEALTAKTGVVVSDIPAHRDVLGHTASPSVALIAPSVHQLAASIAAVAAAEFNVNTEILSWGDVATRTLDVYREVVVR